MLDPAIRDLAQAKNFAALTIIPKSGHPMTHIMWIDADDDHLLINTEKLTGEGSFNFYLTRITDEAEEEFYAEDIVLKEGALVYVNYAEWTDANPNGMYFGVDLDGDGNIDDDYVVDDAK